MSFTNIGSVDRAARAVLGLVLISVVFMAKSIAVFSMAGIAMLFVGGVLIATAGVRFCPLYALFRIRTTSKKLP